MMTTYEAGPELNALVAERIFGYFWYEAGNGFRLLLPPEADEEWTYTEVGGPYQYTPPFSTDIARAWAVVERMSNEVPAHPPQTLPGMAVFAFWWSRSNLWAYSAEHAATRICQAALAIMDGQVPK
jgi:hypothetical protein